MGTKETKAIAAVARERHAFEATWTRYVNALERRDVARASKATGHWRRVARGAFREAERAHAVLTTRFGMDLGGVP